LEKRTGEFSEFEPDKLRAKERFQIRQATRSGRRDLRRSRNARRSRAICAFFNEQADAILVDGVEVPRPVTPWSKDWKEKAATLPDSRGPVVRP
jgi:hypothetical protein